ncbi:unnamed protein product [Ilex paraguariensis]|uniref:Uncharacterized protein n=1 Tax=Ilex paraguariensis TaxID=185542 RepID=A0ABC8RKI6_9AQUA
MVPDWASFRILLRNSVEVNVWPVSYKGQGANLITVNFIAALRVGGKCYCIKKPLVKEKSLDLTRDRFYINKALVVFDCLLRFRPLIHRSSNLGFLQFLRERSRIIFVTSSFGALSALNI